MLKFNEDAIKKDVEETLALRKDVEAAVKKICEKGYNNIFLVGIGGTYAVAEELMSYLKGHSKIEIYLIFFSFLKELIISPKVLFDIFNTSSFDC